MFWLVLFALALFGSEKPFVVVIPSYNNAAVYERNLDSVLSQKYHNFRVIYIDDASTDENGRLVQRYLEQKDRDHRVTFIQNRKRMGALANKYKGAWLADPKEIIVDMDGDDWFANDGVLSLLNAVYSDPEVWVTYGQFVYYPCKTPGWAAQVPSDVIEQNAFRDHSWTTTALRTFYAAIFHKIKREDLLLDGEFFPMAGDLAFMFPIVEMAGKHSRFIPEVLYVYNVTTTINDIVKNPGYQQRLGWIIRERPRYMPLRSLF